MPKKGTLSYNVRVRRDNLRELLSLLPPWDLNYSDLARRHGVSPSMIRKDIEVILSANEPEDRSILIANVTRTFEQAVKTARELMQSTDLRVRAQGVTAAITALNGYLDFMEKLGVPLSRKEGKVDFEALKELLKVKPEDFDQRVVVEGLEDDLPPLEDIPGQPTPAEAPAPAAEAAEPSQPSEDPGEDEEKTEDQAAEKEEAA